MSYSDKRGLEKAYNQISVGDGPQTVRHLTAIANDAETLHVALSDILTGLRERADQIFGRTPAELVRGGSNSEKQAEGEVHAVRERLQDAQRLADLIRNECRRFDTL